MMPAICVGPAMVVMLGSSCSGVVTLSDPKAKTHEKPLHGTVKVFFPKGN